MAGAVIDGVVEVRCDSCGMKAPPAAEIRKGHGLVNMGWACSGGRHFCPEHKEKINGE